MVTNCLFSVMINQNDKSNLLREKQKETNDPYQNETSNTTLETQYQRNTRTEIV